MAYSKNKNALLRVQDYLDKLVSLIPGDTVTFNTDPANVGLFAFHIRQGIGYAKENLVAPYCYLQVTIKIDTKSGILTVSRKKQYEVTIMDEKTPNLFPLVIDLNGILVTVHQNPGLNLYKFPNIPDDVLDALNDDISMWAESNNYYWWQVDKQLEKKDK